MSHAKVAAMTMISLEMLGCEALPLEGMYQSRRHDVLTPQSSPESRNVHQEGSSTDRIDSVGSTISHGDMHPLDQPAIELGLPPHIPEILYCKCRRAAIDKIAGDIKITRRSSGCSFLQVVDVTFYLRRCLKIIVTSIIEE